MMDTFLMTALIVTCVFTGVLIGVVLMRLKSQKTADRAFKAAFASIESTSIPSFSKGNPGSVVPKTATGESMKAAVIEANTATEKFMELQRRQSASPETIDCATCGCMVKKAVAIKGEPYVAHGDIRIAIEREGVANAIVFPYYCKRCAPPAKTLNQKVEESIGRIDKIMAEIIPPFSPYLSDAERKIGETLGLSHDDLNVLRQWIVGDILGAPSSPLADFDTTKEPIKPGPLKFTKESIELKYGCPNCRDYFIGQARKKAVANEKKAAKPTQSPVSGQGY